MRRLEYLHRVRVGRMTARTHDGSTNEGVRSATEYLRHGILDTAGHRAGRFARPEYVEPGGTSPAGSPIIQDRTELKEGAFPRVHCLKSRPEGIESVHPQSSEGGASCLMRGLRTHP